MSENDVFGVVSVRRERLSVMVFPAIKKRRSEATEIAGESRYFLAIYAEAGYRWSMSKVTGAVATLSPRAKARSTRSLRIKAVRRQDNSRPQTPAGVRVYRILLALVQVYRIHTYMIRTKYASKRCKIHESRQHNRHAISYHTYHIPGYRIAVHIFHLI